MNVYLCFTLFVFSVTSTEVKRLAILEFTGIGMEASLLMLYSSEVRSGLIKVVDKEAILVMTRESTR